MSECQHHLKIYSEETTCGVGGGLTIGIPEVIAKFEEMYHKAVLYFLDEKLMNTDQQVLFSLYSDIGRKKLKPPVELQIFNPKGGGNPWFYLGFLCLKKIETPITVTAKITTTVTTTHILTDQTNCSDHKGDAHQGDDG